MRSRDCHTLGVTLVQGKAALWMRLWGKCEKRRTPCEQPVDCYVESASILAHLPALTCIFSFHGMCVETCLDFDLRVAGILPFLCTNILTSRLNTTAAVARRTTAATQFG